MYIYFAISSNCKAFLLLSSEPCSGSIHYHGRGFNSTLYNLGDVLKNNNNDIWPEGYPV